MFTTLTKTLLILWLGIQLVGCSTQSTRSIEEDRGIRSVAVLALLTEQTPVSRIGMTVFNNTSVSVDQRGTLNKHAEAVLVEQLRKARPNWSVKSAGAAWAVQSNRVSHAGPAWTSMLGDILPDLKVVASRMEVDLIFVLVDRRVDGSFGSGVGAFMRPGSINKPTPLVVHANTLLVVVDRTGNEVLTRATNVPRNAFASDFDLDYNLTSLATIAGQQGIKIAMQQQLTVGITEAMRSMGY